MKKKFNFRLIMQITFFVLIALISVNHTLAENNINIPILSSGSIHALCPYGGVETLVSLVTAGTLVKKVHESAVVLLVIILFLSVLFGPVFCSYVCPLGSAQEWLSKIGKKLFPKRYNKFIPSKIDKYLRFLRYIVLITTVYLSTMSLKLVFEAYDPYYALFNFWTGEAAVTSLIVLGLVILSSLLIERAWCKYACPFGALLGITNFFRIFKIRRATTSCTKCNLCSQSCPMNIDVANKEVVKDHQCISCGICTSDEACPVDDTVTLSLKTKPTRNVSKKIVAISIIAILIVGIGIGKLTKTFITESQKIPQKIASGEFAGEYNPADIRGSYSFNDVSNVFDVPVEVLAKSFNINSEDNGSFQLKYLEEMFENVGTSSVREFVALYTGLPYEDESDGLPHGAIIQLLEAGKITDVEYNEFTQKHNVEDIPLDKAENENYSSEIEEGEHSKINSETTIKDAISLGISQDDIEQIIGAAISDENMLVKDFVKANGLRFSEIKDELNTLIKD